MSGDPTLSRVEADLLALRFLRDNGPHTMGPIEDENALAAAIVFLNLSKEGLTTSAKIAPGYVQWAITDAGRERSA